MRANFPYRRSKTNPNRMCVYCGNKIYNRSKNSKYCSMCAGKVYYVKSMFANVTSTAKRKFPDFNISYRLTINKK